MQFNMSSLFYMSKENLTNMFILNLLLIYIFNKKKLTRHMHAWIQKVLPEGVLNCDMFF